jgi:hypothetical protein
MLALRQHLHTFVNKMAVSNLHFSEENLTFVGGFLRQKNICQSLSFFAETS